MNSLDLHLDDELQFKVYSEGNIQEKLVQILSEHRSPMGVSAVIKRMEEVKNYPHVLEKWNNACLTLADAIAVYPFPYGSVKLIKGNLQLWYFISQSTLCDGVIELRGNSYERLRGYHIPGLDRIYKRPQFKEKVFSCFDLSSEGREICIPQRPFPYLTLLAFNNSARVLGTSRLDDSGRLIGIR